MPPCPGRILRARGAGSPCHPERERLVSCRGLLATHPPQGYLANLLDHPLEEVRLHPHTGEFVHPGEFEALKVLQEKAARERRMEQERAHLQGLRRQDL